MSPLPNPGTFTRHVYACFEGRGMGSAVVAASSDSDMRSPIKLTSASEQGVDTDGSCYSNAVMQSKTLNASRHLEGIDEGFVTVPKALCGYPKRKRYAKIGRAHV